MRTAALIITLFLTTLAIVHAPLVADYNQSTIPIYNLLKRTTVLHIYVYPTSHQVSSDSLELGATFTCPYKDRIEMAFYQAVRAWRKAFLRFSAEYPEFERISEIRFVNVSAPDQADIALVVVKGINISDTLIFRVATTEKPNLIRIPCSRGKEYSDGQLFTLLAHELGHALGLGHSTPPSKDFPELMANPEEWTYPSTLDLYAIYQLYFGNLQFKDVEVNITLPADVEYKMVIPYDVELQKVREELSNAKARISSLEEQIVILHDDIKKLRTEKNLLILENAELNASLASLQKLVEKLEDRNADLELRLSEYEDMVSSLNQSLAEAYEEISAQREEIQNLKDVNQQLSLQLSELQRSLSLAEAENQALRQQLQQADQTIQALAILIICLTAITIAVAVFKRGS